MLTKPQLHDRITVVMKMARTARKQSESGIYHVMLRGVNRQQVFLDSEDNQRFIDLLQRCRELSGFRLFAYCLMGNHVHLLLQTGKEPLPLVMKRIGTRYAVWYNSKYERVGHLFQDRYRSEPVDDDAYFFTVLRYILNNPVKAGICDSSADYPLSSARDYFTGGGITDTHFAEAIMGREALIEYLTVPSDDSCMDDTVTRIGHREAQRLLQELVGTEDVESCKQTVSEKPEQYVPRLRGAGLSIRQISQLTGLSFGIVRKY